MDTVYWINLANRIRVLNDLVLFCSVIMLAGMFAVIVWNWGESIFWEGETPRGFKRAMKIAYIVFAMSFIAFIFMPGRKEFNRMIESRTEQCAADDGDGGACGSGAAEKPCVESNKPS